MTAPKEIIELVERFDRNIESYKSGRYNETQLRREFIDPFFEALGWDVNNKNGYAEAYKEVIHEDSIKVGAGTKAPDYCFRVGGTRKFFLETKKPSVDIKNEVSPAYQIRRYAWSAKLPLSILSDFEELAVYDCRINPLKTDKSSVARVLLINFKDYAARWDEISAIFSKEAIQKGAFDRFAESSKKKRGTTEVDDVFLKEIETWREMLAKDIAKHNQLTQRELNFTVQRTIDRIIFLRICEDRGIEEYGGLMALQNGSQVYSRLCKLFGKADDKYNSGLFHFREEKNIAEPPDELTLSIKISDEPLKDIIKRLYYPESPYEFSIISADILGQVYEQFLGKIIALTDNHKVTVEEKPEVRKAGGVYYTPSYIVDYIVKNTVGKLLEGKNPRSASKLKIVDPACGSGHFLIGAYQCLLDWHLGWYVKDGPKKWAAKKSPILYQDTHGEWRLTATERKRILANNIFGVDIDPQAVEVTKLSLLLKVLEGETEQTLNTTLRLFHERALPDLGSNIKCGNSLISTDFYENQQVSMFDEEERQRINAFDWNKEFKEIMESGGFDAVIGNPPYGFHQIHTEEVKPYFKNHYESSQGSYEHYFLFYERSLKLLKENGIHGFIVPVTWLTIPSAKSLRRFVLNNYYLKEVNWLPEFVFENAKVNTIISIIQKTKPGHVIIKIYDNLNIYEPAKNKKDFRQLYFIENDYQIDIFQNAKDILILKKIRDQAVPLSELALPCSGYNPYEVGKGLSPGGGLQTLKDVQEKPYNSNIQKGKEWKPEIVGRNISRYFVNVTGKRWIKYGHWLAAPRDPNNFAGKRILVQEVTGGNDRRIVATYYDKELYHSRDVIPVKAEKEFPSILYLLGIVNSKLITWYHHKSNPKAQKALFPKVLVSDLAKIPIHKINVKIEKPLHDKLVILVTQMLDLNKQLLKTKTPHDKESIQRQIEATDKQIDQLVYKLYGLTEEEIGVVEGK